MRPWRSCCRRKVRVRDCRRRWTRTPLSRRTPKRCDQPPPPAAYQASLQLQTFLRHQYDRLLQGKEACLHQGHQPVILQCHLPPSKGHQCQDVNLLLPTCQLWVHQDPEGSLSYLGHRSPMRLQNFLLLPKNSQCWMFLAARQQTQRSCWKRYFVTLQKQLSFNFYKYKLKFFKVDTTQADTEGLLEEVFCKGSRQNPQSRKKSVKGVPLHLTPFVRLVR